MEKFPEQPTHTQGGENNLSFIQMDKPEIKIAEQPKTTAPENQGLSKLKKVDSEKSEKSKPLCVNSHKAIKGRYQSRAETLTFLMPSGKS